MTKKHLINCQRIFGAILNVSREITTETNAIIEDLNMSEDCIMPD